MEENKTKKRTGTVHLEVQESTYKYEEASWVKDDEFIYLKVTEEASYMALIKCKPQRALISEGQFNYTVEAPGRAVHRFKGGESLMQYLEFKRVLT
jgi:sortase (surface protein transpeptidase)